MEQCLILNIRLFDDGFGSPEERDLIVRLEDIVEKAIKAAEAGEFDGDEFGQGYGTLYMYGPDVDRLYDAVWAKVGGYPFPQESFLIKRYGPPGAREVRQEIGVLPR